VCGVSNIADAERKCHTHKHQFCRQRSREFSNLADSDTCGADAEGDFGQLWRRADGADTRFPYLLFIGSRKLPTSRLLANRVLGRNFSFARDPPTTKKVLLILNEAESKDLRLLLHLPRRRNIHGDCGARGDDREATSLFPARVGSVPMPVLWSKGISRPIQP
jgi:hypothetical protein